MSLKYLVTGTGRSGTVFMARLLTSLNIPCGHESVFDRADDINAYRARGQGNLLPQCSFAATHDVLTGKPHDEWLDESDLLAESSYLAAPFIDYPGLLDDDVKVIHVVRNPINVVSSFVYDVEFFMNGPKAAGYDTFVSKYLPALKSMSPCDTPMKAINKTVFFWTKWNKMVQQKSIGREYFRFNVEDKCTPELLDFLDVDDPPADIFDNDKINSWKVDRRKITLDSISDPHILAEFQELAEEYGYKLNHNLFL